MLAFDDFIHNNYFNSYFVEYKLQEHFIGENAQKAFENIINVYQKLDFDALSEAQLEEEFIKVVLQELGYFLAYQVNKKSFGKNYKPNFALFESENVKNEHYSKTDKAENENILALCESKSCKIELDNKKIDSKNPHFQLIRYLNDLKISFGFLTNGCFWRLYDVSKNRADKVFYEINLEIILQNNDFQAFQYFYYIFCQQTLISFNRPNPQKKNFLELQAEIILQVENDLKELIYGQDSIIETIGQKLFNQNQYSIREIYANSLFFGFRMLFIAYFESKFYPELFKKHKAYSRYSLRSILFKLQNNLEYEKQGFDAWNDLKLLFQYLNQGNLDIEIPLLNGGLFAISKAPLLELPWILDNADLLKILKLLLHHQDSKAWRDYKTLSVTHIGNIYEGLLESEFRQAFEGTYYLEYLQGKNISEGYFDDFDYQRLKNDKKVRILKERLYENTEIYLSNQSNTRKTTASYYTPSEITHFMAKESIEKSLRQNNDLVKLKILDNACGSGHFLIETLNILTKIGLERLDNQEDVLLKQLLETEKATIVEHNKKVLRSAQFELDELTLLKRILLKKIIFGVDLNDFAIELTRLSLWLDTFILGTPLSFIEHHVKQGNALIGYTKNELFENLQKNNDLFANKLKEKINFLVEKLSVLSNLKDNTPQEVAQSKQIYESLQPDLQQLNLVMNFYTYKRFLPIMQRQNKAVLKEKLIELNAVLTDFEKEIFEEKNTVLVQNIKEIARKFSFFNYEIEFAECFQNWNAGFDLIIGNPPWDKTKFDDKDFFSMWRSSYRSMKHSEKEEVRINILDYKGVSQEYENNRNSVVFANDYYKEFYPQNAGVGDNNLFRFFIERNLTLLCKKGVLTLITPSSWIFEDSSIKIRKHIFQNYHLHFFYQFENKKGIFPAVDSRYKFAIFQITHKKETVENSKFDQTETVIPLALPVRFMQTNTDVLYENQGKNDILYYPYEDIYTLSPNHWALFEIKSDQDLPIIRKVYQQFQPLSPDYLDFRNELHMTNDRDIFREKPEDMILYEGKMIHQFRNDFANPQYWIKQKDFENRLTETEISRLVSDIYEQMPEKNGNENHKEYLLKELKLSESDLQQLIVLDSEYVRLCFRGIARNTDIRTLITAIIPQKNTYGSSMFGHIPKKYVLENGKIGIQNIAMERVLFVQSLFNSILMDYLMRFLVDMNVSKTYLMRLPVPQPVDEELLENDLYKKLIVNTLKLNLANNLNLKNSLADLQKRLKITEKDLPKTEKQRIFLQIENDVLVGKLYGLTLAELKHLSGSAYFKILNEKQAEYLVVLYQKYEKM